MKNVTKKGQWFTVPEFMGNETITVQGFYGETGIEYDTAEEAKANNDKFIVVKNKMYGGIKLNETEIDVVMSKANGTL